MRFSTLQIVALIAISFITGCIGGGGFISLEGDERLEVVPLDAGNDCVNYDITKNEQDNLYEAAKTREDNEMFFQWLEQLCQEDTFYCDRLKGSDGPHTLLLPTNEAVKAFITENPDIKMEAINLRAIVKYHTLVSPLSLTEFSTGVKRTMNRELLPITVEDGFCVYFGNHQGQLQEANDICSNGYIHTVNKVLIPNRNFK